MLKGLLIGVPIGFVLFLIAAGFAAGPLLRAAARWWLSRGGG